MTQFATPRRRAMGDAALLVELGDAIDEHINARTHALARAVELLPAVIETIPAYASLLVEFDPARISHQALSEEITHAVDVIAIADAAPPRVIEIPMRYGGKFGPDLEFVAAYNHLSTDQVIHLHTSRAYRVFMLGFAPGFPYLGLVPEEIAAPRLDTPRVQVAAGSVGIAGRQTGIYPRESPGGWRLIGRTDVKLFDPIQDPPTLLRPGDEVRFLAIT